MYKIKKLVRIDFISTGEEFESFDVLECYFKTIGNNTFFYVNMEENNASMYFNANDIDLIQIEDMRDET